MRTPRKALKDPARPAAATGRDDLAGRAVLITAGPTYEAIDPVRFIGNRSSGKMGFALARAAAARGAAVTLVAGPVALPTPAGVHRLDIESAAELAAAVLPALTQAVDVIIMSAAVADYRPAAPASHKLKKSELGDEMILRLEPTLDVLAELGRRRGRRRRPLLVGFAAETGAALLESYARRKLAAKRCDMIVANDVAAAGSGFGSDTNRVLLLHAVAGGLPARVQRLPLLSKDAVAERILDAVVAALAPARRPRRPPRSKASSDR